MNKRIISVYIIMLMISISLQTPVSAGSEEDPEIEDESEDDIFSFLDIISAWFYEKEDHPEYLFIRLKLKQIDTKPLKQHLTVHWELNGVVCAAMMAVGYDDVEVVGFSAGFGHGFWFQEHYQGTQGEFDEETGIITIKVPKSVIKNPEKGDVLTNTYALTFQRFGFIGLLGFDRVILQSILFLFTGESRTDVGPNDGYGRDYEIQY